MAPSLPPTPPLWWYHEDRAELRRQAVDPEKRVRITGAKFDAEFQRHLEIAQRDHPRQRYYQQWYAEAETVSTFWRRPYPKECPPMIEDEDRAMDDVMEAEEARLALVSPGTRLFTWTASGSLKLSREIEQENKNLNATQPSSVIKPESFEEQVNIKPSKMEIVAESESESAAVSPDTKKPKAESKVVADSEAESVAVPSLKRKTTPGEDKMVLDFEAEHDAIPNLKRETTPGEDKMVADFVAKSAAVPANTKEAQPAKKTVKTESKVEPYAVPTSKKGVFIKKEVTAETNAGSAVDQPKANEPPAKKQKTTTAAKSQKRSKSTRALASSNSNANANAPRVPQSMAPPRDSRHAPPQASSRPYDNRSRNDSSYRNELNSRQDDYRSRNDYAFTDNREGSFSHQDDYQSRDDYPSRYEGSFSHQDDYRSRDDYPSRYEGSFSRRDDYHSRDDLPSRDDWNYSRWDNYRSRDNSYSGEYGLRGNRDSGRQIRVEEVVAEVASRLGLIVILPQFGSDGPPPRQGPPLPPVRERRESPDRGRSGPNYHFGNRSQSRGRESRRPQLTAPAPERPRSRDPRLRDRRSRSPAGSGSDAPPASGQPHSGQGKNGKGKGRRNRGKGRWRKKKKGGTGEGPEPDPKSEHPSNGEAA